MKIAIIGAGPAAAFAYRACMDMEETPRVFAPEIPKILRAAFFFHWIPESVSEVLRPIRVLVEPIGDAEGYSRKMWGRGDVQTSFPQQRRIELWYDPEEALPALWDGPAPVERIRPLTDEELVRLGLKFDFVFYSFPTLESHMERQTVTYPVLITRPEHPHPAAILRYSGRPEDIWCRMTGVGRSTAYEFPTRPSANSFIPDAPVEEWISLVDIPPWVEPLDESGWPAHNVIPIGRLATWDRKAQSHLAYQTVTQVLSPA